MIQPTIEYDFSILKAGDVQRVVDRAAVHVAENYGSVLYDRDDLRQEAALILASRPTRVGAQVGREDYGYMYVELVQDLIDRVRPELKRANRLTPLEVSTE